jgi:signal peptidase I
VTKSRQKPKGPGPEPPDRTTIKKAERFLRDVEKLYRKHAARVSDADKQKLEAAIDDVAAALDGKNDRKRLSTALKELDGKAEQILGFAKKSTFREYAESIGIAIGIAVVLRAFVVEAFKIPTGSMIPTLEVGDHIFVNKFIYGLRIPLTNEWFVQWGAVHRGDVIVFRYPRDLSKDYIKRVVAVAGDRVRVDHRDVYVNGEKLDRAASSSFNYVEEGDDDAYQDQGEGVIRHAMAYAEKSLGTDLHYTVIYEHHPEYSRAPWPRGDTLPGLACTYETPGSRAECEIQNGYVFVMGDNRDNSSDSRVWGAVPIDYVKGKAMFIWWSRGPRTGVRLDRIGTPVH